MVVLFCVQHGSKPSLGCIPTATLAAGLLEGLLLLLVAYVVVDALYFSLLRCCTSRLATSWDWLYASTSFNPTGA